MILDQEVLRTLPELGQQDTRHDPVIYIKLSAPFPRSPEQTWRCYIAEGGHPHGDQQREYEVFAVFVGKYGHDWEQLPLSAIEQDLHNSGLLENLKKEIYSQPVTISTCAGSEFLRKHIK